MTHPDPHVLALTGAVGSGKSTVAGAFAALGVPCLDADLVARAIHQDPAHPAMAAIAAAFPQAMASDGRLARGSLRSVFARDAPANAQLKQLLRPWVLEAALRWTAEQDAPYVVWESALIGDQGIPAARVLVVDAPSQVRMARLALRNPDWTPTQVAAIFAMQPSREAYLEGAHDVIVNAGTPDALARMVQDLHRKYTSLWSTP